MGKCLEQRGNLKRRMRKSSSSGSSEKMPGIWVKREEAGHSNCSKYSENLASFQNFEEIPRYSTFSD